MKTKYALSIIGIISITAAFAMGAMTQVLEKDLSMMPLGADISKAEGITLLIDTGEGSAQKYETEKNQSTAFEVLDQVSKRYNFEISSTQYETGIFIKSIAAKENGEGNKYWIFYVNGKMAQVSADKQVVKAGDIVEFRFQNSPF